MDEKKNENLEAQEVELEETEIEETEELTEPEGEAAEEKEVDSYGSISEALDIPEYEAAAPKKKCIKKGVVSKVVAAILVLLAIAHVGFNSYNAYMEFKAVYAENSYDEVFKQEYIGMMDNMIDEMRVASVLQSMMTGENSNVPSNFEAMVEAQGKTLDQFFEENMDKIKEDFKDMYDKGKAEWLVEAEEGIFADAKKDLIDEIADSAVTGILLLVVAGMLICSCRCKKEDAKEEEKEAEEASCDCE